MGKILEHVQWIHYNGYKKHDEDHAQTSSI